MPRFGVWDLVHARAGVETADLYAQHLAEMELAEALGFDEYWLAEHIFHHEHSLLPSPGLLLAAASGRVQRLRLGVLVHVLPFHDPLRLAGECTMLDQLTRGRLCVGIGRGARLDEYSRTRVPQSESRSRFEEATELLLRLWREDSVDHDGLHYRCRDATLAPRPYQRPHPPLVMATVGDESLAWAARRGIGIARGPEPAAELARAKRLYDEAYRAAGHAGRPSLRIMRQVYLAPTDAEARERARPWLFHFFQLFSGLRRPGVAPTNEAYAELTGVALGGRFGTWTYDAMIDHDLALICSPASVAAQLGRLLAAAEVETFLGMFSFGTMPREAALANVRRFVAEVLPAVRAGQGEQPAGRAG
jgi:alkanesulfonate monooxygenase SsuD/methylene tetrahydromethanopterin reductase-like flavin-dependent oxidoreductase (luciferase family)